MDSEQDASEGSPPEPKRAQSPVETQCAGGVRKDELVVALHSHSSDVVSVEAKPAAVPSDSHSSDVVSAQNPTGQEEISEQYRSLPTETRGVVRDEADSEYGDNGYVDSESSDDEFPAVEDVVFDSGEHTNNR